MTGNKLIENQEKVLIIVNANSFYVIVLEYTIYWTVLYSQSNTINSKFAEFTDMRNEFGIYWFTLDLLSKYKEYRCLLDGIVWM